MKYTAVLSLVTVIMAMPTPEGAIERLEKRVRTYCVSHYSAVNCNSQYDCEWNFQLQGCFQVYSCNTCGVDPHDDISTPTNKTEGNKDVTFTPPTPEELAAEQEAEKAYIMARDKSGVLLKRYLQNRE